jgi:lambda repressor-like predicted transcriptional regulator
MLNIIPFGTKRGGNMVVNRDKLALAMAKAGMTTRALRQEGKLSPQTVARIKSDPNYRPNPVIIGRLAKALGVEVEEIVEVDCE